MMAAGTASALDRLDAGTKAGATNFAFADMRSEKMHETEVNVARRKVD